MSFELTSKTTAQELFDYITDFLMEQGKVSVDFRGQCMYRGDSGCKCAVGAVLPDGLYRNYLEGTGLSSILGCMAYHYPAESAEWRAGAHRHQVLLSSLQSVHDTARRHIARDHWLKEFKRLARSYKLVYDPAKHIEKYGLEAA